jgi:hypothetical protein
MGLVVTVDAHVRLSGDQPNEGVLMTNTHCAHAAGRLPPNVSQFASRSDKDTRYRPRPSALTPVATRPET